MRGKAWGLWGKNGGGLLGSTHHDQMLLTNVRNEASALQLREASISLAIDLALIGDDEMLKSQTR